MRLLTHEYPLGSWSMSSTVQTSEPSYRLQLVPEPMPRRGWEGDEKRKIVSLVRTVPKAIHAKDKIRILKIYDTHDPMFCTFEDTPDFPGRVDGPKFREFIDELEKF